MWIGWLADLKTYAVLFGRAQIYNIFLAVPILFQSFLKKQSSSFKKSFKNGDEILKDYF
jgi:hypothetical protein